MMCRTVNRRLTAFLENRISDDEHREVRLHLAKCRGCAANAEAQRQIRASLRALPERVPPADLKIRLQVLASKELAADGPPTSEFRRWLENRKLDLDNIMKPLALPAAGGLCATLLLFLALLPAFTPKVSAASDVPLGVSTAPQVRSMAPIGFPYGDAEVELQIDGYGRLVNYSIVSSSGKVTEQVRRSIENSLLFTTFTPATTFGVAIPSKIRLSFQSSSIDVKG